MGQKLKIVLADVPMVDEFFNFYQPTLGILYLIGALRKNINADLYEVHYLDGSHSLNSQKEILRQINPDIVGISFKTPMAPLAYKALNEFKKIVPTATFIAGGSHPSIMFIEVFENSPVDFVFRGECEESFPFFIEHFIDKDGRHYESPGLVYKDGSELRINPLHSFEKDLDSFPWPSWEIVDFTKYPGMPYRKSYPYMGVVVSRGCPFKCTFCSEPIWKIFGKPSYRARSVEKILEEITYLYNRGVRELRLWCEELNTRSKWTKELMRGIIGLKYKDLYFNFNIRGDVMDEELAELMKEAGTWMVSIGIESSSNRVLSGVQKMVTVEQISNACELLSKRGIKIQGYFQFFNAWEDKEKLQIESFKEAINTILWALRQFHRGQLHYMFTSFSTPIPDTPLWTVATKYNLLKGYKDKSFNYINEGMILPSIPAIEKKIVFIFSFLVKAYVGILSGNLNPKLFLHIARRNLKKYGRVKISEGY
jgi:anaerobic magnesium-protoporphyrin IX monomethyl ester cyclase